MQVGAIEQQIFGIGVELLKLGHEVHITRNWETRRTTDVIEGVYLANVQVLANTRSNFPDSLSPINRIVQASYLFMALQRLRKLKLDALIVPGVVPAFICSILFRRATIPKVFVANNNDIFVHPGEGHSRIPKATQRMMGRIGREYDATVAVTRGGQQYLLSRGMNCQTVIPNAVNPENYSCKSEDGFILTAGRLVPHKKIEHLVDAFAQAEKDIPERLVIVGSGPKEKYIRSLIRSLGIEGRVNLARFLPRSAYLDLLSKCTFFVLPSQAEAFGVAVVEAMASRKPVIARDTIGPRDIITPWHDGLLFSQQTELEQQIRLLSADSNLRTRIGINARETVMRKFAMKNAALQYERLIDAVIKRRSRLTERRTSKVLGEK